ncbi:adenosine 3' [Sigmodon hispidus]
MDLKFNNSRKYVSITVPSKTQTMSPHIKSVDDIVVLGMNLSKFNKLTQFFICVAGVFVFYLIYGYLQELIFSMEGFKPYGWYLTLVQFAFYSIFGLIELQLIQDKRRRIPGKTYMIIAFLTVGTMGLSNTSLGYLNYPTQVIFKCCKLIPVMLGGVFIQGKRYNLADVSAAVCMSLGLIWFTLADSTIAPNFNLTGVMLISLALCADAVIGNVQEKAMKLHNASNSEMVLYSYSIGFVYILLGLSCTSGLGPAVAFCSKNPVRTYGYAFLFSLTGYFGISFVLALIKIFGALLAVTDSIFVVAASVSGGGLVANMQLFVCAHKLYTLKEKEEEEEEEERGRRREEEDDDDDRPRPSCNAVQGRFVNIVPSFGKKKGPSANS